MAKVEIISECANKNLRKRQICKFLSKSMARELMRNNPNSQLYKSYKNTTYCSDFLISDEVGKIKSTYCKNRWCAVCNRIKMGRLINAYLPQLSQLKDPVFVTLTLPTVEGAGLKARIDEMQEAWRLIYKKSFRAKYKKDYPPMVGIRKAECTIRPDDKYHYHFHIIVDGWFVGEWIIAQWLRHFPEANRKAQDIRIADENRYLELFKYAFKSDLKGNNQDFTRYDFLFNALRKKQTVFPFGGIKPIKEDFEDEDLRASLEVSEGFENSVFKWRKNDWYRKLDDLALVGLPIPDWALKQVREKEAVFDLEE